MVLGEGRKQRGWYSEEWSDDRNSGSRKSYARRVDPENIKVVQQIWIGHIERWDLNVKRCGLP